MSAISAARQQELRKFARQSALHLEPQSPDLASGPAYEADELHAQNCVWGSCPRCWFEKGFRGELRRGCRQTQVYALDKRFAWSTRFVFEHPNVGTRTWLTVTPYSAGKWAAGCWVCNASGQKYANSFSKIAVDSKIGLTCSAFQRHEVGDQHVKALTQLKESCRPDQSSDPALVTGVFTGMSDKVPRIDKFHLAGTIVSRHGSFSDFEPFSINQSIGSSVCHSKRDTSRHFCTKLVQAMSEPFRKQDQLVIREVPRLHKI